MPIPLGKNKIIYKTVESKEVQIFTYNDSNLIDMYVPIIQGSIVGAVLVLKQVCSSMVNDVVWQHILTSYTHLNQMLYTAEIDPLTGLMNRLAFERLLNRQAENISIVEGVNTYFSLVDIDFFKKINDNFGHLYGDEVLILLTRAMMESFRSMDWLFRYGGEEFGIVLIDVDCTEAYQALERFRIKIETMIFPQVGTVTVSIGFSQMNRLEPISSLVDRADHALYYVKNHGRNQVLCYENLREEGLLTETEQETKEIELF